MYANKGQAAAGKRPCASQSMYKHTWIGMYAWQNHAAKLRRLSIFESQDVATCTFHVMPACIYACMRKYISSILTHDTSHRDLCTPRGLKCELIYKHARTHTGAAGAMAARGGLQAPFYNQPPWNAGMPPQSQYPMQPMMQQQPQYAQVCTCLHQSFVCMCVSRGYCLYTHAGV
jgi:hypothetical protein